MKDELAKKLRDIKERIGDPTKASTYHVGQYDMANVLLMEFCDINEN